MSVPTKLGRLVPLFFVLITIGLTLDVDSQQKKAIEADGPAEVRCVLQVDNRSWRPGSPAEISVRLENLTDRDLVFKTAPEFQLTSARGDCWAPTDIVDNKPIETREVGIGGLRPVPIKLRLAKNSASVFQIDAAKTHWERTISSIWPSGSLGTILPGPYLLRLEFMVNGNQIRSNGLKIEIENKDPR